MWITVINIIAFVLTIIGGLNWGLVGIFNWNVVTAIFGSNQNVGAIIVYITILAATLWLIFASFFQNGKINFKNTMDSNYINRNRDKNDEM